MTIREYRAETDFDGLRRCVVELQDYEYRIDNRFPDGESIADAYIPDILERCAQYDGRIFVADMGGEAYARDCGAMYLRVGVMAGNRMAWKLYDDQGFVECHIELENVFIRGRGRLEAWLTTLLVTDLFAMQ